MNPYTIFSKNKNGVSYMATRPVNTSCPISVLDALHWVRSWEFGRTSSVHFICYFSNVVVVTHHSILFAPGTSTQTDNATCMWKVCTIMVHDVDSGDCTDFLRVESCRSRCLPSEWPWNAMRKWRVP
jgi:hypothetical protein